jgi:hypothetical protein
MIVQAAARGMIRIEEGATMSESGGHSNAWTTVDEGWGRGAGESLLAYTGPAYEAIQNVGQDAFHEAALHEAPKHVRDGLPLRAEIDVVGYLAPQTRGG